MAMIRLTSPHHRRILTSITRSHILRTAGSSSSVVLDGNIRSTGHRLDGLHQPVFRHHSSIPGLSHPDFCQELVPLYPSLSTLRRSVRPNGVRFMTTEPNKPTPPGEPKSSPETTPPPSQQTWYPLNTSTFASKRRRLLESGAAFARRRELNNPTIKVWVDSMDTTLKRVRSEWDAVDLLSVFGIAAFITGIILAPKAARHMQRSDTNYDDLDPDDPVTDLANFVRSEFLEREAEQRQGSNGGSEKSTLGGMDSFVGDLLRSPQIQNAVNQLVTHILQSPEFKKACSILLKELWKDLVEDPETLKQVVHLLHNAIQDEAVKEAAIQLVTEVFSDKEVLDEVVELFQRLGQEKKVQVATQGLLVESAHNALNDPEILDHSMEFATDVVGDDVVQQTAGEALYNTLTYAVRPTLSVFLTVLGGSMIVLSYMAFRNASSPDSQTFERALSILESSSIMQGITKLLSLPWDALAAFKDATIWICLLPARLITGSLTRLGWAGDATVNALNGLIHWIINLPVNLAQSAFDLIGLGMTAFADGVATQAGHLAVTFSGTALGVFFQRVADTFSGTSKSLWLTWDALNATIASGSYAIENVIGKCSQLIKSTLEYSSATRILRDSVLFTPTMQKWWVSTNRILADGALGVERALWREFSNLSKSAAQGGVGKAGDNVSKKSIPSLEAKSLQEMASNSFRTLDHWAESLGFILEDLVFTIRGKFQASN